jgi:hypothetical protein
MTTGGLPEGKNTPDALGFQERREMSVLDRRHFLHNMKQPAPSDAGCFILLFCYPTTAAHDALRLLI